MPVTEIDVTAKSNELFAKANEILSADSGHANFEIAKAKRELLEADLQKTITELNKYINNPSYSDAQKQEISRQFDQTFQRDLTILQQKLLNDPQGAANDIATQNSNLISMALAIVTPGVPAAPTPSGREIAQNLGRNTLGEEFGLVARDAYDGVKSSGLWVADQAKNLWKAGTTAEDQGTQTLYTVAMVIGGAFTGSLTARGLGYTGTFSNILLPAVGALAAWAIARSYGKEARQNVERRDVLEELRLAEEAAVRGGGRFNVDELTEQLNTIEEEIEELKEDICETEKELDAAKEELQAFEKEYLPLSEEQRAALGLTHSELCKRQKAVEGLEKEIADMGQQIHDKCQAREEVKEDLEVAIEEMNERLDKAQNKFDEDDPDACESCDPADEGEPTLADTEPGSHFAAQVSTSGLRLLENGLMLRVPLATVPAAIDAVLNSDITPQAALEAIADPDAAYADAFHEWGRSMGKISNLSLQP